eukprot:15482077-Alexandrium_andersonii.AAC.1
MVPVRRTSQTPLSEAWNQRKLEALITQIEASQVLREARRLRHPPLKRGGSPTFASSGWAWGRLPDFDPRVRRP